MSEQSHAEKTEQPTGKRRGDFRKEGNIARSQDIGAVVVLIGVLSLVMLNGDSVYQTFDANLRSTLNAIGERHSAAAATSFAINGAARTFVATVAGIFLCAVTLGGIAGLAQTQGNFTTKVFEIKWGKFNPFTGIFKQLINIQKLQEVGLSLLKATAIGGVLVIVLRGHVAGLLALAGLPLLSALSYIGTVVLRLLITMILVSAVLAIIDYILSYRRIHQQMKMTKQEVKDERKQSEGDPEVKKNQRLRMFQMGYNRILAATTEADVVLVNPTHFAVALAYKPGIDAAPRLLAKGKDAVAFRIREVARKHQIPVISNPPVTRAIYNTAKVGAEIPAELYEIVAGVLAYVYRMTRRIPA